MSTFIAALEQNVRHRLARRTPYWPGPGNATTESDLLVIPEGHIPPSFVEWVSTWVNDFSEQCIVAGQSPDARISMVAAGENSYKLRAVS